MRLILHVKLKQCDKQPRYIQRSDLVNFIMLQHTYCNQIWCTTGQCTYGQIKWLSCFSYIFYNGHEIKWSLCLVYGWKCIRIGFDQIQFSQGVLLGERFPEAAFVVLACFFLQPLLCCWLNDFDYPGIMTAVLEWGRVQSELHESYYTEHQLHNKRPDCFPIAPY